MTVIRRPCPCGAPDLATRRHRRTRNDPDTAYNQLELARQMADRLGEGCDDYNTEFGPANVTLYEVAVAVELGERGPRPSRRRHRGHFRPVSRAAGPDAYRRCSRPCAAPPGP